MNEILCQMLLMMKIFQERQSRLHKVLKLSLNIIELYKNDNINLIKY